MESIREGKRVRQRTIRALGRKDATDTVLDYGPDRERTVQTRVQGAATTEIVYVAGLFERVRKTGEATRSVHYVFAGSARIAIRTTDDAPTPADTLRYLHHDHLGSVDTITDAAGAVVERLSYDAFGKRRVAAGEAAWTDSALAIAAVETPRGFTGHEHLDDFQLVHMNGRIQDPHLGRFISADPFVQFPESTQGLNRYSYAGNNPLSFTDPSGYFFKAIGRAIRGIGRFFRKILNVPIVNTIANIAMMVACGTTGPGAAGCMALGSAGLTAAAGGDPGDIIRAGAIAFASAAAFQYVGHRMPLPSDPGLRHLAKTLAHGVVGGVRSAASGGRFGQGFLAAGFAQLAAPAIGGIGAEGAAGTTARVIAAAAVGGTASRLGGGKFANGALTAAFGRLYNDEKYKSRAMRFGERWRGRGVRATIRSHHLDINSAAQKFGVDADLIRGLIYEEQTHLLPVESYGELFGIGNTVGLGQITVGLYGFSRQQLLNPAINIQAIAEHISNIQSQRLINGHMPFASIATIYNCGSCKSISDYGMRVSHYRHRFAWNSWD